MCGKTFAAPFDISRRRITGGGGRENRNFCAFDPAAHTRACTEMEELAAETWSGSSDDGWHDYEECIIDSDVSTCESSPSVDVQPPAAVESFPFPQNASECMVRTGGDCSDEVDSPLPPCALMRSVRVFLRALWFRGFNLDEIVVEYVHRLAVGISAAASSDCLLGNNARCNHGKERHCVFISMFLPVSRAQWHRNIKPPCSVARILYTCNNNLTRCILAQPQYIGHLDRRESRKLTTRWWLQRFDPSELVIEAARLLYGTSRADVPHVPRYKNGLPPILDRCAAVSSLGGGGPHITDNPRSFDVPTGSGRTYYVYSADLCAVLRRVHASIKELYSDGIARAVVVMTVHKTHIVVDVISDAREKSTWRSGVPRVVGPTNIEAMHGAAPTHIGFPFVGEQAWPDSLYEFGYARMCKCAQMDVFLRTLCRLLHEIHENQYASPDINGCALVRVSLMPHALVVTPAEGASIESPCLSLCVDS